MNEHVADIHLDFDRRRRTGLDETVFAQAKTPAQLAAILATADSLGVPLLLTRLTAAKLSSVQPQWAARIDYCAVSLTGFFGSHRAPAGDGEAHVAIVSGGSADAAVAREAERTLLFNGVDSVVFTNVGAAGLWRLTRSIHHIGTFPVVIAVAGMEAALPTVLGGMIPSFIVAVPTSVGYGVAAGGQTALHALLASCAPGITVVDIDNGHGAACAAIRALRIAGIARERRERAGVPMGPFVDGSCVDAHFRELA
jgi:NCAIR mutase (PurE)-related protein